jgi:16S rRNA (guanine966-N2)-methyltransferase
MRITSGAWRGRTLVVPSGRLVRPTSDRVRQAMFNLLRHGDFFAGGDEGFLSGVAALDVFAGSGALGLEALSNGAAFATFVENARPSLASLRENIANLDATETSAVIAVDATKPPLATRAHNLVFLDPPYRKNLGETAIMHLGARGWFAPDAVLVLEEAEGAVTSPPPGCALLDTRRYGDTEVHILRWAES